jgi:glycosyltransferase involved in cell wall biosynthesis
MPHSTPLVSVNLVTYNHQDFIAAAIRSVLTQTFSDLELMIVDDGSTDRTGEVVKSFSDPRIRYLRQANQGPSVAANNGIACCRGKFLALMSGDDICHPARIERQLAEYGKRKPCVLFSRVDFIDDGGADLGRDHFAANLFDAPNLPRSRMLEKFFNHGNYLNGVTTFTEREIFLSQGTYNELFLQLQDFEMWMRLAKRYDIWIMPDKLLSYRVRGDGCNLSFPSRRTCIASLNEQYVILSHFFDGISASTFKDGFANQLVRPEFTDGPEYLCEQALAYLRSPIPVARLIGLERINSLWHVPETGAILRDQYQFTPADYFQQLRTFNYLDLSVFGTDVASASPSRPINGQVRGLLRTLRKFAKYLVANPKNTGYHQSNSAGSTVR